jgi:hypothetical protein
VDILRCRLGVESEHLRGPSYSSPFKKQGAGAGAGAGARGSGGRQKQADRDRQHARGEEGPVG